MGLGKMVGETATELVKNENVQNKAVGLLGMLCPYIGMEKRALDLYIDEIKKSDLSTDAKMIALFGAKKKLKMLKNQKNVAEIAVQNAKEGTDFSESAKVDEEWFERFMEAASFVSSEEMQLVWGKILANEFEEPGCNPPNMIRILSEFTPAYAKAFRMLCSMRALLVILEEDGKIKDKEWINIIAFTKNEEYMKEKGLSFVTLNELETLGVIKFDAIAGYCIDSIKEPMALVCVNGNVLEVSFGLKSNKISVGNVLFTAAGEALRDITEPYTIEGYEDIVKEYLISNNMSVLEESSYDILIDGEQTQIIKKNVD